MKGAISPHPLGGASTIGSHREQSYCTPGNPPPNTSDNPKPVHPHPLMHCARSRVHSAPVLNGIDKSRIYPVSILATPTALFLGYALSLTHTSM